MAKENSAEEKKQLILVVDDVPKNVQVLGNILSGEGYQIAAATDGEQAIKMSNEIQPDLILLDIMMPEIDGMEVCRVLKNSPKTEEIPIIFITAKTEKEDIVKGFNAGSVDYITKPFNTIELLARVKTHLKLKSSMDTQKKLNTELTNALAEVKRLSGLLPICSHCKKIRDDNGYWKQVEDYVENHSEATFSHSICPDCLKQFYPDYADKLLSEKKEE